MTALYLDGKADERTCAVLESGSKQRHCKGNRLRQGPRQSQES